jgi:hypothetical protein
MDGSMTIRCKYQLEGSNIEKGCKVVDVRDEDQEWMLIELNAEGHSRTYISSPQSSKPPP